MKKSSVILMWGVITSIIMSAYSFAINAAGSTNKTLSYITFVIMFVGLLIGMRQFRDKVNGGYASFGELYKVGILMVLIIAVFSTLYFFIYLQVNPGFIDRIREQAQADMVNKGMTPEQMEMGVKMMDKFTSPTAMVIFGLLGNLFFGAIVGLLAAGISSKAKPFTEGDNNSLPA
ncbi:MAG TPA: DUF4199 domain-containing protein [Bacteroidia bacterium]|jgi:hypothetical protein|nr:DUF4199 domain-containing protein [Bacteroidia bacterium]